jgi:hypothetical protein
LIVDIKSPTRRNALGIRQAGVPDAGTNKIDSLHMRRMIQLYIVVTGRRQRDHEAAAGHIYSQAHTHSLRPAQEHQFPRRAGGSRDRHCYRGDPARQKQVPRDDSDGNKAQRTRGRANSSQVQLVPTLSGDFIRACLYSISDNNSFLNSNKLPVTDCIALLHKYFHPSVVEPGYSLAVHRGGSQQSQTLPQPRAAV